MATDKSKTSKTARVMNLLSKKSPSSAPAEPPAEDTAAGVPVAAGTPVEAAPVTDAPVAAGAPAPAERRPQTPPILNSITADAAASNQIRSALEDALAAELDPAPAPQAAAQPKPAPAQAAPTPTPAQPVSAPAQAEPAPTPAQPESAPAQAAPAPTPAQPESAPAQAAPAPMPAQPESAPAQATPAPAQAEPVPVPQAAPTPAQTAVRPAPAPVEAEEQPGYINVMQVLVDEKAPKYVKMFGLCDCKRCMEDVKALALNHLPPKYVVLSENDRVPKLTFYEGQYGSDITAQLLKACQKVAERPHHTRN